MDQSTPATEGSLETTAVRWAVCAVPEVWTYTFAGRTLIVMLGGVVGVVIENVALADLVVSVSEVAITVTVPPIGTAEGAV
jgi:hypothetical protein